MLSLGIWQRDVEGHGQSDGLCNICGHDSAVFGVLSRHSLAVEEEKRSTLSRC